MVHGLIKWKTICPLLTYWPDIEKRQARSVLKYQRHIDVVNSVILFSIMSYKKEIMQNNEVDSSH